MSRYPVLNKAYLRITAKMAAPALVDWLRPRDKASAKAFDRLYANLESTLALADESNVDALIKAGGQELRAIVPKPEQLFDWVSGYDWSDYLGECYAAGYPTGYDFLDDFEMQYFEDPTYFIAFAQIDLILWRVFAHHLKEVGVTELVPTGVVFIAAEGGDEADLFQD